MCFSLEYCGVESKTEAVPPSQAPLYTQATVQLLVLDPSVYLTRPHLLSVLNLILPFALVMELDHEWLVVCISQKHAIRLHLQDGFVPHFPRFFWCDQS